MINTPTDLDTLWSEMRAEFAALQCEMRIWFSVNTAPLVVVAAVTLGAGADGSGHEHTSGLSPCRPLPPYGRTRPTR